MALTQKDISLLDVVGIPYSACVTISSDGTFSCDPLKLTDCTGWKLPNKELCDSVLVPVDLIQNSNGSWISSTVSEIEFDNLSLTPGMIYGGGMFMGVYDSSTAITFEDGMNPALGSVTALKTSNTKYAIILNTRSKNIPFLKDGEDITEKTSYFDGFYNKENIACYTHDTLLETKIDTQFVDWYIPSISELIFMYGQMSSNHSLRDRVRPILNSIVLSSTVFKDLTGSYLRHSFLNRNLYNYGLDFASNTIKYINPYVATRVLFIRMIPIE